MIIYLSLSLGFIVAALVSYSHNKSLLWALIHGLFGWLYIIYFVVMHLLQSA